VVFGAIDKVAALLGSTEPLHWLTMAEPNARHLRSEPVDLYEIDGRTYIIDIHPSRGWASRMRSPRQGTLTTGRTDTEVTLTEVTDPAVKHQVVIAYAAEKPKTLIASGEDKHRKPESILVILRIAPDDTPQGLAAAVPRVAVFEVTPTRSR
jgi:hypothetical protein